MSNIKFLLDEDVSANTLKRLRRAGFQVESVDTLGIKGTRNSDLLHFALKKEYILITHDHDFANLALQIHFGILVVMIHPATDDVAGVELEKYLRAGNLEALKNKVNTLKMPRE
jgi:predicted nuclease of predicted toxin-antitoxin system